MFSGNTSSFHFVDFPATSLRILTFLGPNISFSQSSHLRNDDLLNFPFGGRCLLVPRRVRGWDFPIDLPSLPAAMEPPEQQQHLQDKRPPPPAKVTFFLLVGEEKLGL